MGSVEVSLDGLVSCGFEMNGDTKFFLKSRNTYVFPEDPTLTDEERMEIQSRLRTIPDIVMPLRKFRQKIEMLYQHDCGSACVTATDGTDILIAVNGDFISIKRI